ncbi:hypothetical protein MKW98_004416, partial [Papaver atlanticum]
EMSKQVRPEAQDANESVTLKVKRTRGMAHSSPDTKQRGSPSGQVGGGSALTSPHAPSGGEQHESPSDPREVVLPAFEPFVEKASLEVGYEDFEEVGGFWVAPRHVQSYAKIVQRYGYLAN